MFIDPNELIEIKIYYKRNGRHYEVIEVEDYKILEEEEQEKYKCLVVQVRELTWGLYNELNEESVMKDNLGGRQWNYKLYKENKLRKILASWDAQKTNDKGIVIQIPLNIENIKNLAPEIAEQILNSYDAMMIVSEDDEKK